MRFQIISGYEKNIIEPHNVLLNNKDIAIGIDLAKELGNERVKNVFLNIEKALVDQKVCCSFFTMVYC